MTATATATPVSTFPFDSASVPGPDESALTAAQLSQFHRDGYLVLPHFLEPTALLSRAKELVQGFSLQDHPLTTFSTGREGEEGDEEEMRAERQRERQRKKHVGDQYFLESGDKVRFFLEEEAVGPDGKLNRDKSRAVNKVGHALHLHDPHFYEFTFSKHLLRIASSLGVHKDPRVLQSMIICKQPSIGGAVPHHNDSTFLYTDPPSAIGFWFALEDCTRTNGCLSFLKGSHRWPKESQEASRSSVTRPVEREYLSTFYGVPRGINARFVRKGKEEVEDGGTTFIPLAQNEEAEWNEEAATIEECKAGSLVLIHGSVLHQSKKNLSEKSRYIYTFHMIEGDTTRATYDELNWLQMPRTGPNGEREPFSQLYHPPPPPPPTASTMTCK